MRPLPSSIAFIAALTAFACGGAVSPDPEGSSAGRSGVKPSPGDLPPAPAPSAPARDHTVQPANVAEGRKQCETPPTDWEDTLEPKRETYEPHHWVMCKPSWDMFFRSDDTMLVEGQQNTVWDIGLVQPAYKILVVPFPVGDETSGGYGIARGVPQHARGGLDHWLRLPVNPQDSGLLAPKLHGQTEAIFVRVTNP